MNSRIRILFLFSLLQTSFAWAEMRQTVHPHLYALRSHGHLSFLFGTTHLRVPLSQLPPYVMKAFNSRPRVAKEIISTQEDGQPLPRPPATPGSKEPPRRAAPSPAASAQLLERGIPEAFHRSPWICIFYYTWEDGDAPIMDNAFEGWARRMKKPLSALDEQVDLDTIDEVITEQNLQCDIEASTRYVPASKLKNMDQERLLQYFSGDLGSVRPCDDHCQERSQKWLPKIVDLHANGGAFILFGVGHLSGPSGVLSLLQKEGYEVMQIRSAEQLDRLLKEEPTGRSHSP